MAIATYENGSSGAVLLTVFQQLRETARSALRTASADPAGFVVAFTSAQSGEGVTYTVDTLLSELARDAETRTLLVPSSHLRGLTLPPRDLEYLVFPLPGPHPASVFELSDPAQLAVALAGPNSWDGSWHYRQECIETLRANFDYVLIDTPALRDANDVLALAPLVDGVIVVVGADKTRKEQVLHVVRSIQFARGKVLGHILNKRSYLVPAWLYHHL